MRPGPRQKSLFHAEMAKLLEAGFDIRKAADAMRATRLPRAQESLLDHLSRGLDEGRTIADALAADRAAVGEIERHMLRAGERGGRLAQAFRHLADYFEMIAQARAEILKSRVYPLVMLHLGLVLAAVPGTAILDGLDAGELLPRVLRNLAVAYGMAAVLAFLFRLLWSWAARGAVADRVLLRVPWLGRARRDLAMARFCHVYHACLLSGLPMVETVRVATRAARSGMLLDAGESLAAAAASGHPLGPAFLGCGAFPPAFARSYATAEEAGALDTDLERWARLYQAEAMASLRRAAVALPKFLYLLILLFVGWRIVRFYTGYFQGLEKIME